MEFRGLISKNINGAQEKTPDPFYPFIVPAFAREALALPPSNKADFIQEVFVPAGTRLQRSRTLPVYGKRGGAEQFQLLNRLPEVNFGSGVPFQ